MDTWKALAALAIVVAGAVGAFAVYTFGWRESTGNHEAPAAAVVTTDTGRHRLYTIRRGDVLRVPGSATQCEASGEAGIPNLFCTRIPRGRFQIVFWKDSVDVYDLLDPHLEPMVPTFNFKWEPKPQRK
jgi:hypothetical protein